MVCLLLQRSWINWIERWKSRGSKMAHVFICYKIHKSVCLTLMFTWKHYHRGGTRQWDRKYNRVTHFVSVIQPLFSAIPVLWQQSYEWNGGSDGVHECMRQYITYATSEGPVCLQRRLALSSPSVLSLRLTN